MIFMNTGKINSLMVLEVLGRPKETVEGALKAVVEKLSKEKGVRIIKTDYHETIPVETAKDLFTTFVEIELEFDSIEVYYYILFAYMPSHIEISSPSNINLTSQHLTEFGNKLLQRLHDYDSVVKKTLAEKNFLTKKLYEFAPHLFKQPSNQQALTQETGEKILEKENKKPSKKNKKKKSKKNKA